MKINPTSTPNYNGNIRGGHRICGSHYMDSMCEISSIWVWLIIDYIDLLKYAFLTIWFLIELAKSKISLNLKCILVLVKGV